MAIDPLIFIKDIIKLGQNKIFSIPQFIPTIDQLVFDNCYLAWIIYISVANENHIRDAFIFVEDVAIVDITKISDKNLFEDSDFVNRLEKNFEVDFDFFVNKYQLDSKKLIFNNQLQNENHNDNEKQEIKQEEIDYIFDQNIKTSTNSQTAVSQTSTSLTTIRVTSEKVDNLMNLVSELISVHARLNNFSEQKKDTELELIVENINKVSRQLRDTAFEMSMVPLQEIIIRFQRLIRDLSLQLDKEVEFITSGTNTEIDKRIIEN